jgi:mannose-6-phosphate isomerase-like protein (cupin superfamily)
MSEPIDREILLIPSARQPVLKDEATGFARRCLSPVLPGRGIDWLLCTLPPGATAGDFVAHRYGVDEYVYVLHGRLGAHVGEKSLVLERGDSLFYEADAQHAFTNLGASTCEFFIIIDSAKLR